MTWTTPGRELRALDVMNNSIGDDMSDSSHELIALNDINISRI